MKVAMAEWKPSKLNELGFVGRGKSRHRPRNDAILYGGPYPFFQTGDIKAANFYLTEYSQTYSEEGLAQSKLWKPGTLCITIAANIAESAILGIEGCFPDSVVGFVADPAKADVRFIKYYMEILKLQMQSASRGTTQDNLSLDKLLTFDFLVPTLSIQKRIAEILSAYDELIENNQRCIKILESMARALYREWFVHFRFPGHENVPRVASEPGGIPQGWEAKKLGDVSSYINRGISPAYDEEGDSVVINQKCIRNQRLNLEPARNQSKKIPNEKLIKFGDILINSTGVGTLGRVAQVYELIERCTVDTHVTIARANSDVDIDFYGCALLYLQEKFESLGIGATGQTELSRTAIAEVELVIPTMDLQRKFGEMVRSIRVTAQTHGKKNRNLRRTRDLLLPRLLSGQIKISIDEEKSASVISLPIPASKKATSRTTDEFVEAVVIAQLVRKFSDAQHPLGRKRYNKFAYLAHRKVEDDVTQRYLKKAAGPYSPWAKYAGPEGIAKKNGYIKQAKVGQFEGFVVGDNIDQIDKYTANYPVCAAIDWVNAQLRYKKTDELELLATVDFAAVDLNKNCIAITAQNIKQVIQENPEWAPKLERAVFSDSNIQRALNELHKLYPGFYSNSME